MHTVSVSVDNHEKNYQVKGEKPLFDEISELGTNLPHGCLSGSCGACRIEVLEGIENLSEVKSVEKDTIESLRKNIVTKTGDIKKASELKIRLSCRAKAKGVVKFRPLTF